ncbi:MAG TPA: ATP-binding protein, partial [Gaiellaceae bacterium]|nr:ATP-binding protein [Gaiellaceae bacterium]
MTATGFVPYKGLRMFEDSELDVPFFFGRERERGLVEANLMASRLTVLYGETGVGKSSLLRAGVAHHLRAAASASLREHGDPELAVVVFDAWRDDPVDALRRACTEEVTRALGGKVAPRDDGEPLAEALRVWQQLLGGDLYIVLDQLEEYFLYHQDEDGPGTFAAEFPAVVTSPDLRVNFLLAVREDAVAKLDAFKPRIPNVLGNYLRLEHLDRDAGRAAIIGPIDRYNELVGPDERVQLEPELVDAVLEQVVTGKVVVGHAGRGAIEGEEPTGRIETPYLQLVMQRLWEEEQSAGSLQLRVGTLRELGGAEQIVGDHVARALTALTPNQQDLAATMFDYLVTPSGTKIAHEVADLERYAGAQHHAVVSVLDKLSDDRIVRPISNGSADSARYEIFHDVLAQPVLAWKATHDSQRELDRQRAESERRHRRLLGIVALGAVALVVMAGITIVAITQRSKARSQADIARASQLSALSVSQLQIDPQRSLVLAVEAAQRKPTSESEDALRQALLTARERAILPSGGAVTAA